MSIFEITFFLSCVTDVQTLVFNYFSKVHQCGHTSGPTALYCVDMERERPILYTTNVININSKYT